MAPNQNVEKLLYDFTLQVGDSVKDYLKGGMQPTIVAIDSVLVGCNYRKRWMIDTNKFYPTYLVEGIGSTFDLLESINLKIANSPNYSLNCFQNGQTTFNGSSNCPLITNLNEKQKSHKAFFFYPNPVDQQFYLRTKSALRSAGVYNLPGSKVMELDPKERSWKFPVKKGLYLVRIQDEKGMVYTQKVIKK